MCRGRRGRERGSGAGGGGGGGGRKPGGSGTAVAEDKAVAGLLQSAEWLFGADDLYPEDMPDAPFMDAVVKVYCTHTEPNFSLPWQKRRQYSSTGSGFMISHRRLLTNAHCVEHHTQVKVKRRGDDTKFLATVLAIGTECDIALLSVEDDEFWRGPEPLTFGSMPRLQARNSFCSRCSNSRGLPYWRRSHLQQLVFQVTSYVHGASELLGAQIDAAINSGNSGGPAFNERGECVGIAFQSLKGNDAENIGYVIPTPVIFHFLNDYERNGHYTGFPVLGIIWQKMENSALRSSMGLKPHQKGVLVRRVEPTSFASSVLQQGDVIMSFDGIPVANDGTVPFRAGERISFGFLISQKVLPLLTKHQSAVFRFAGEVAELELVREGKVMSLTVPLKVHNRLIPVHIQGRLPSYYIIAGLVFTPVCQPFLVSEYGPEFEYETPVKLLDKMMHGMAEYDNEQVVVLSQVLANDVNIGYEDITNSQVLSLNGEKIRNLQHLAHLVDTCTTEFLRFSLELQEVVVLEMKAARPATADILRDHCIPSDRSEDLKVEAILAVQNNGSARSSSRDSNSFSLDNDILS
eukprot:SM000181S03553  [mRNA]  locus=s181:225502:231751:- [translate_table: standard]